MGRAECAAHVRGRFAALQQRCCSPNPAEEREEMEMEVQNGKEKEEDDGDDDGYDEEEG